MKLATYFAVPVAVCALAFAAVSQTTPEPAEKPVPMGAVGKYQLMSRPGGASTLGTLYRINTQTGQTWRLAEDESPVRWVEIAQP